MLIDVHRWQGMGVPRRLRAGLGSSAHGYGAIAGVPQIHMPRRASRLTLEITGVRVQRVQEISGPDCLAEGINTSGRDAMLAIAPIEERFDTAHLRNAYAALWDSINSARGYGWSTNPWVWAISFKVVSQ